MPKRLSEEQVRQYHEDGFCFPVDVMTPEQALDFRARIETVEREHPEALAATTRNNAHITFTCLDEIVHHQAILDAVEDLIGPDILCQGTVMFTKEANTSAFVSWHQDLTYVNLQPHDGVTAWLALSPATVENGCMQMIPGSHRQGIQTHSDTFGEDNILTRGQNIDDIDASKAVNICLQPGQMSLHHGRTIHSSGPNNSADRRMGVAIQQYIPPYVKGDDEEDYALRVRGEDGYGHFTNWERPTGDLQPEYVRLRQRVNQLMADRLYSGAEKRRAY